MLTSPGQKREGLSKERPKSLPIAALRYFQQITTCLILCILLISSLLTFARTVTADVVCGRALHTSSASMPGLCRFAKRVDDANHHIASTRYSVLAQEFKAVRGASANQFATGANGASDTNALTRGDPQL
jgi:hypothetical protein